MSEGLNRFTGIGNLGADPELKVTAGGQALLRLNVACSHSFVKKDSNERTEVTEWVRGTVFGKRAEGLAKILKKGDRIFFEGRLHTSSYEKDGEKRYSTEINVDNVILAGGGKGKGGQSDADESGGGEDTSGGWDGAGV